MDVFKVLEIFKQLSGLSDQDAAERMPLCSVCAARVKSMLRADVDAGENSEALSHAAACLAFYSYTLGLCANDAGEYFSAGDVKVSMDYEKSCSAAEKLKKDALEAIVHLCEPSDFCFIAQSEADYEEC